MKSGRFEKLGIGVVCAILCAGCFNTQLSPKRTPSTQLVGSPLSDPTPSPSPSPSPSSGAVPIIAQCREGSTFQLTSDAVLSMIPGAIIGESTLTSLTPVLVGEAAITQSTSTSWTIKCPSQFVHWQETIPSNRFLVTLNYQYRSASGATRSGNVALDVYRWTLAPSWTAAGPATYTRTPEGRILITNGTQQFILPQTTVPGSGATLSAPLIYAVAKAPDNVALYAIGSAPQGSALYRVHPSTGELWTLSIASLPAPTVDALTFVSASELELQSLNRSFSGPVPSSPRTGQIFETPVSAF